MLTLVKPLSAGSAVRCYSSLPAGAVYTRILRKTADTFTGPTDAGAVLVLDTFAEDSFIDLGVADGTTYFWHAYDWIGSAWVDSGPSLSATPATTYIDDLLDPQELVRSRVQRGLDAEVARGSLKPQSGAIQVTTAPFALADGITFPTVSVHLESTGPAERSIGDELEDFHDPALGEYIGSEGWLARFSLTLAGVSLNADERIALRKALRRIIQANLPIFADAGMVLIEFQQTDSEQFSENNAPLYMTNGAFSCIAPAFVREVDGALSDVTQTLHVLNPLTGSPYPYE
jgi:uncharacterized membrane protein